MERTLIKYLYTIDEYFHKSVTDMLMKNDCLPYIAKFQSGDITGVIDYEKRVPDTFDKYQKLVHKSFNELVLNGMFNPNLEKKVQ